MADGPVRGRLAVSSDLSVEVDDERVDVWSHGDGSLVVVSAPSLGAARRLLAAPSALPVPIDSLDDGLRTAGVGVEVRVRHATVARLGAGLRPSRLSRLVGRRLGLPAGTVVSPRGVVVATLRRLL